MAGGGTVGGQVIGASDRPRLLSRRPARRPGRARGHDLPQPRHRPEPHAHPGRRHPCPGHRRPDADRRSVRVIDYEMNMIINKFIYPQMTQRESNLKFDLRSSASSADRSLPHSFLTFCLFGRRLEPRRGDDRPDGFAVGEVPEPHFAVPASEASDLPSGEMANV